MESGGFVAYLTPMFQTRGRISGRVTSDDFLALRTSHRFRLSSIHHIRDAIDVARDKPASAVLYFATTTITLLA
jgi:hypothetical protein